MMTGEMGRSLQGPGEIGSPFQGRKKLPRQKRGSDSPISLLGIIEGLPHARHWVGSWRGGGRLWRWEMWLLHEEAMVQPSHGPQGSPQLCALDLLSDFGDQGLYPSLKQSRKLAPGTVRGQGQAWSPPDRAEAEEVDMRRSLPLHGPALLCLCRWWCVSDVTGGTFHFYCCEWAFFSLPTPCNLGLFWIFFFNSIPGVRGLQGLQPQDVSQRS